MDKILFLNEKDRNTGLSLEHSDYRYKTTKPVAATKPKHDEVGFTIPYAMFRPIREPGLLCELLGDNPVRRTADLKMNFDFLVKDLYENEISRLMYVVRLEELRCRLIFSSEDRAWERYTRLREKGQQAAMPKVTSDESRKTLLKAITWKYDWIQQHKIQCFRFAEAVYARQMKDETSQSRFIEAFIQYAANLPEPNRRLLDEMYELAWYDIQLYPCSLEGKRLVSVVRHKGEWRWEMLSMPSATQNWQTPSFCRHSRIIGKHCSSWCRSRRNGNTGPAKRSWSDSSTRSGIGL